MAATIAYPGTPVPERCSSLELLFAGLQAILVFVIFTGGAEHPYLFDDNKSQWLPVTNYGLEQWLEGRAPHWNPYILNGIRVDEVGYYGLANPLMAAAYILSWTGVSNTLSLYIALCVVLGSLFAHALARNLGSGFWRATAVVLMYQLTLSPWSTGHWHYAFNNFLMFPALFWGLHRFLTAPNAATRTAEALRLGLLFGFAFALGNAQFAVYQWFIVGGIGLSVLVATKRLRRDYCFPMITVAVALAIAAPTVWMLLTCGKFPLGIRRAAAGSPVPISQAITVYLQIARGNFGQTMHVASLGALPLMLIGPAFFVRSRKRRLPWICLAACGVFLLLIMIFASGILIKHLPVLNKFRVAYKWWFCAPPLLLYGACLVVPLVRDRSRRRRLVDATCAVVGVAVALVCAVAVRPAGKFDIGGKWTSTGPPAASPTYDFAEFQALAPQLDLTRYRVLPVNCGPDIDALTACHASPLYVERHITANAAAQLKIFSAAGYHIGLKAEQVENLRSLLNTDFFYLGADAALVTPTHDLPLAELAADSSKSARCRLIAPTSLPTNFSSLPDAEATRALETQVLRIVRTTAETEVNVDLILEPEGRVADARSDKELFWRVQRGRFQILGWANRRVDDWLDRVKSAGVNYLLVESKYADELADYLRGESGSGVEPTILRGRALSALEIGGAGLVTDRDGRIVPFKVDGGGLTITPDSVHAGPFTVRFNFDDSFSAVGRDPAGRQHRFALRRTPEDAMQVDVPPGAWKTIDVRVRDGRLVTAAILNLLSAAIFIGTLFPRRSKHVP